MDEKIKENKECLKQTNPELVDKDFSEDLQDYLDFVEQEDQKMKKHLQYDGEFRYVNMGPQKIQQMLEDNPTDEERKLLELALRFWDIKKPGRPG